MRGFSKLQMKYLVPLVPVFYFSYRLAVKNMNMHQVCMSFQNRERRQVYLVRCTQSVSDTCACDGNAQG